MEIVVQTRYENTLGIVEPSIIVEYIPGIVCFMKNVTICCYVLFSDLITKYTFIIIKKKVLSKNMKINKGSLIWVLQTEIKMNQVILIFILNYIENILNYIENKRIR